MLWTQAVISTPLSTRGSTHVTVGTHYLASSNFLLNASPTVGSQRCHIVDLGSDVVELQDHDIILSAVNTGMFLQVLKQLLLVDLSPLPSELANLHKVTTTVLSVPLLRRLVLAVSTVRQPAVTVPIERYAF